MSLRKRLIVWKLAALAALCWTPIQAEGAANALVILDMQDYFLRATGTSHRGFNRRTAELVLESQIDMIRVARQSQMPVLLIEYWGVGRTMSPVVDELIGYEKLVTMRKFQDDLFEDVDVFNVVVKHLIAWRVTDLIIMGANGGCCVKQTIKSALRLDFNVWAFSKGIADFNYKTFLSPYRYPTIRNPKLREFTDPRRFMCLSAFDS